MSDESTTVARWLYSVIHADATLSSVPTYEEPAPSEVDFPRITYSQNTGGEIQGQNGVRVLYDGIWLVKGIDRYSSFSRLEPIANKLDELLHRTSGVVSSGVVLYSVRQETIRLAEITNGIHYRHLGYLFRIGAQ